MLRMWRHRCQQECGIKLNILNNITALIRFFQADKNEEPNPYPKQLYLMIMINTTQPQQTYTAQHIHAHTSPPFPERGKHKICQFGSGNPHLQLSSSLTPFHTDCSCLLQVPSLSDKNKHIFYNRQLHSKSCMEGRFCFIDLCGLYSSSLLQFCPHPTSQACVVC